VSVAAADDFSVALCDQGHVYSWGFGLNYMKGWTPFNDTPAIAEPVAELLNKRHSKIKKMAAVDRFVMLLLDNGRLYSYGNSKAGVFGARTNPLVLSDLVLTSFFRTYDAPVQKREDRRLRSLSGSPHLQDRDRQDFLQRNVRQVPADALPRGCQGQEDLRD
jgi:alpha-tubulin suppressor-like RCC1 family protein